MLTYFQSTDSHIRQRWIFAFMGFLALVVAYGFRISLSITITQMVHPPNITEQHADDTCPIDILAHLPTNNSIGVIQETTIKHRLYHWNQKTQGTILSSFYWGYVITQLPGALLAEKFGGKHVLGFGILSTAIFTLLTPIAANVGEGSVMLIILRVLMGLCEGVTLPALNVMLSQWTPANERSKIGSFVYVGAPLGTVFATLVSGMILKLTEYWPNVFYFFGGIGVIWYLFWCVLCYSTPATHPFISHAESAYLQKELSEQVHKDVPPVPWKHLLKSMPLWALIFVQIGHDWGFYTTASDLPKYMSDVLHFKIEDNSYASSLPYVGMWLCCVCFSWIADWLITKNHMSITAVRKLGTTIASIGPAFFIVGASFARCDSRLVVIMFTLGITLLGAGIPSLKVNALDLSPNYSGTVMALSNGAASCAGILTPWIVGILTTHSTISEWRIVFWIIFVILIATNIFFLLFASGEIQAWNDPVLMNQQKELDKKKRLDQTQEKV